MYTARGLCGAVAMRGHRGSRFQPRVCVPPVSISSRALRLLLLISCEAVVCSRRDLPAGVFITKRSATTGPELDREREGFSQKTRDSRKRFERDRLYH